MHVVYGGAFNPPTVAHLEAYHFLKSRLPVKRFTYLPVSNAYTKSELASDYHRLNMLRLMIQGLEDVDISELEIKDDSFKGTYQSLVRLSDDNVGTVAFVIGADNVPSLPRWKWAGSLLGEFKIIVLGRDGIDVNALIERDAFLQKYRDNFIIFNDFNSPVSSTEYRRTMNADMIHTAVRQYIEEHDLYMR